MAIWQNRTADPQIHMEFEEALISQNNIDKKKNIGVNIHDLGFGNGFLYMMPLCAEI